MSSSKQNESDAAIVRMSSPIYQYSNKVGFPDSPKLCQNYVLDC